MAYLDSTTASLSGTTSLAVAVPTGVAANDIVLLAVSMDSTIVVFTFPANFTVFATLSLGPDGGKAAVGWKRLTGADAGNYTVTSNGSTNDTIVQAIAFTGRHTTDPPVASNANQTTGQASPVSVDATTVTAVSGDDLCWISLPDVDASGIGNGHTAPTGYSEKEDAENLWVNMSMATKENVSAGATGTVSGTFALTSGTSGYGVFLVRIPMAAAGGATVARRLPVLGVG